MYYKLRGRSPYFVLSVSLKNLKSVLLQRKRKLQHAFEVKSDDISGDTCFTHHQESIYLTVGNMKQEVVYCLDWISNEKLESRFPQWASNLQTNVSLL